MLEGLLRAFGRTGFAPAVARTVLWSLVLRPGMDAAFREQLTDPVHARGWHAVANVVPEPAASRCRGYAAIARAAAG